METFIKTYDNAIPHVLCDMLIEKFDANTDQWENRDKRTEDRGNLKFLERGGRCTFRLIQDIR